MPASFETQYLRILAKLVAKMRKAQSDGKVETNRTSVKTVSLLGQTLSARVGWDHLPILTTKYVYLKGVIVELVWFLSGSSNIRFLLENKVDIWTENAFDFNKGKDGFPSIDISEYRGLLLEDLDFCQKYGNLGGVYGVMWRDFEGVDQIERAARILKTKPESRQNLVLAWNPAEIENREGVRNVALPPCHFSFQFHVRDGKLSITMYQRSADWFLGVPFNITSYALLLLYFAKLTGYEPGFLYMQFGDAHLYENHLDQAEIQLSRAKSKLKPPSVRISDEVRYRSVGDLRIADVEVVNYSHLGALKAPMAV